MRRMPGARVPGIPQANGVFAPCTSGRFPQPEPTDPPYGEGMGYIFYGTTPEPIEIDDRTLAHLKVVIATKLRRNESFTLSWRHPDSGTPGRSTLWLHPSIPLRFTFDEPNAPVLSQHWLKELAASANTSGGILLTEEHIDPVEDESVADDTAAASQSVPV